MSAGSPVYLFILYMVTFAMVSPLGILIGIGITQATQNHHLTVAILQGKTNLLIKDILYKMQFAENGR